MPRYSATASITSVESQPCSSCATASAAITAELLRSGGYLATSRSMRWRAAELSMVPSSFLVPVVDAGGFRRELGLERRLVRLPAADRPELARIGVLPDFGVDHRADRDVTQLRGAGVDELVRHVRTARWTADEIALAHRIL